MALRETSNAWLTERISEYSGLTPKSGVGDLRTAEQATEASELHFLQLIVTSDEAGGTWRTRAECAKNDPELFFPEKGAAGSIKMAKAICKLCSVQEACLNEALANDERSGIWGGLTPSERSRLKNRARNN